MSIRALRRTFCSEVSWNHWVLSKGTTIGGTAGGSGAAAGAVDLSPGTTVTSTIPVSALAVGGYTANAFNAYGFDNPAGNTAAMNNWLSSGSKQYIYPTDLTQFVATSQTISRDQEVTTWQRTGWTFLRYVSGTAIQFELGASGGVTVRLVTGATASLPNGTGHWDLATGSPSGYDANATDTAAFTFGVSGFDIYVKYNGVQFIHVREIRHVVPGKIALVAADPTFGYRDVTANFYPTATAGLHSDTINNMFDWRDFPFKTAATTGSMLNGSNQLTVASATGFAVGDTIIVATTGEAAGGARGTVGVGGTWPALSYANLTAMQADTSKTDQTYGYNRDTGDVYIWYNGSWHNEFQQWYTAKAIPQGLFATITAISGTTLTLDKTASVATTNAGVFFDNYATFNSVFASPSAFMVDQFPANVTLNIPAGSWAFSRTISPTHSDGWVWQGAGKDSTTFFSPLGAICFGWNHGGNNRIIQDMGWRGNFVVPGFNLDLPTTPGFQNAATAYKEAAVFTGVTNGTFRRCKATDCARTSFGSSFSANVWAYDCDVVKTAPDQVYIQWHYQWANSIGGGIQDCSFYSPYMTGAAEMFQTSGAQMIRFTSHNGAMSSNSCDGFLIDAPQITVTAGAQYNESSFSLNNPIININSNINNQQGAQSAFPNGGEIRNPTIIQEGFVNEAGDDIFFGIIMNEFNINTRVTGTYPDGSPHQGRLDFPNLTSGSPTRRAAIESDAANGCIVDGIRVVGTARPGESNISMGASDSIVRNCVADAISAAHQTNNQTNATWLVTHTPP